ncbi:hypothetical protein [Massilia sp. CT11-137]|uniref:hypothetical protein n=1 Tax=Massilia sp. CT11-137 TaxID=3393901 RepID=UPI0039B12266
MTTAKISQGSRTQLSGAAAALNSLASATYVAVGTITHNSGGKVPLECFVELAVTPGTVSGNKQAVLFAQASLDGTNFDTGPTSGTTTTDEPNLIFVGVLPLNSNATLQRKKFSLANAHGGVLPYATKLIVKNDSGAAFASSGNDVYTLDLSGDLT